MICSLSDRCMCAFEHFQRQKGLDWTHRQIPATERAKPMMKIALLAVALLASSQSALAQAPDTRGLGGGGQLHQIPPAPAPQRAIPEIRIEPGAVPAAPGQDQIRIPVKSLRVTGQTLYSEAELIAIAEFKPGSELTFADLRAMASRIADYYHRNGYIVAQAYLPAQDIKDGAVTIAVIEGRYGNIDLRNQSSLSNELASGMLDGVKSGDT